MITRIIFTAIIFLFVLSFDASAQSREYEYLKGKTLPAPSKKLHIEQYLATNSLFPGNLKKISENESFSFYRLPLDGMICMVPNNSVKLHINVYDPTSSTGYQSVRIPNSLLAGASK